MGQSPLKKGNRHSTCFILTAQICLILSHHPAVALHTEKLSQMCATSASINFSHMQLIHSAQNAFATPDLWIYNLMINHMIYICCFRAANTLTVTILENISDLTYSEITLPYTESIQPYLGDSFHSCCSGTVCLTNEIPLKPCQPSCPMGVW